MDSIARIKYASRKKCFLNVPRASFHVPKEASWFSYTAKR